MEMCGDLVFDFDFLSLNKKLNCLQSLGIYSHY